MPIPTSLLTTTCDIYKPFGSAIAAATEVPCRLAPDLYRGRASASPSTVAWTHYLDIQDTVDLVDGCVRTDALNTINYYDGDEVRVPSGGTSRYVVVWVEMRNAGTPNQFQRAYLMRHSA